MSQLKSIRSDTMSEPQDANLLSHEEKESFVKILSTLAATDGALNESEKEFLISVALSKGIDEDELNSIINSPEPLEITIPEDEEERIDQLAALIGMMMIDGSIYDEEFQFCAMIAKKYGFNPEIANDIIADILEQ